MLSKSQARAFFLGGTGVFSLAFLALTYDSHRQVPKQTNEENLTEQVVAGKKIWEHNNCMGCHTLFGEGAYYAPELTKVVDRRGKDWIRLFLKDPQKMFPGDRKMVNYHFNEQEIEDVIAFLEWCGEVDLNEDDGCGLHFCSKHLTGNHLCQRCAKGKKEYAPKADHPEWVQHVLTDDSWGKWRDENPKYAEKYKGQNDE